MSNCRECQTLGTYNMLCRACNVRLVLSAKGSADHGKAMMGVVRRAHRRCPGTFTPDEVKASVLQTLAKRP